MPFTHLHEAAAARERLIPPYKLTLRAAERMIAAAVARAEELNVSLSQTYQISGGTRDSHRREFPATAWGPFIGHRVT